MEQIVLSDEMSTIYSQTIHRLHQAKDDENGEETFISLKRKKL
jgi:hypothetical protein